jgi:hypothetical protein
MEVGLRCRGYDRRTFMADIPPGCMGDFRWYSWRTRVLVRKSQVVKILALVLLEIGQIFAFGSARSVVNFMLLTICSVLLIVVFVKVFPFFRNHPEDSRQDSAGDANLSEGLMSKQASLWLFEPQYAWFGRTTYGLTGLIGVPLVFAVSGEFRFDPQTIIVTVLATIGFLGIYEFRLRWNTRAKR